MSDGFGDGSNTGNISGVNWRLDKDYSHYGGHQWFFNAYTKEGTVSNSTLTINGGTYRVNGDTSSGSSRYANYFYGGFTRNNGSATGNGIIINDGNFVNESDTWQSTGIYAANAMGEDYAASDKAVVLSLLGYKLSCWTHLPWGLDIALFVQGFILAGRWLRAKELESISDSLVLVAANYFAGGAEPYQQLFQHGRANVRSLSNACLCCSDWRKHHAYASYAASGA